jgi:hypothetical protein
MDDISEDFEELGRGSPCRIKKEPRADGSHLPAMRLEECDVLAGLKAGCQYQCKDCGYVGAFAIEG